MKKRRKRQSRSAHRKVKVQELDSAAALEEIAEVEKRPAAKLLEEDRIACTEDMNGMESMMGSIPASEANNSRNPRRKRSAVIERRTKETDILLELNLDGSGQASVNTGIGFFDHMLVSFAKHGFFDLKLTVKGDLYVDSHHTIEDTGIVLGEAIKVAAGDKKCIKRYGSLMLPMDESLALCAVDLSGRPYLVYQGDFTTDKVGYMDVEMVKEFFHAVTYAAGMNLHMKILYGSNNHHMIEAMFKAFAKALDEALTYDGRITDVLSAKGVL